MQSILPIIQGRRRLFIFLSTRRVESNGLKFSVTTTSFFLSFFLSFLQAQCFKHGAIIYCRTQIYTIGSKEKWKYGDLL